AGYFEKACEWMRCGRPVFDVRQLEHLPAAMIPGLRDGDITTTSLERWSLPTDFGREYYHMLRDAPNVRVITDATCVRLNLDEDDDVIRDIDCRTLSGRDFTVSADQVILAAGGLESTR